jgi:hypothetical protein
MKYTSRLIPVCRVAIHPGALAEGIQHPWWRPVITIFIIFIGGMFTIPSHGWLMTLFYTHYM